MAPGQVATSTTQKRGTVGSVVDWLSHPFTSSGSALNWILFVGLLVIAAWFWNHVLLHIEGSVS